MDDIAGTDSTGNLDLSSLEDLSDNEKSELMSFMETLKSSVEDGTFDADTLATSAPDALTTLAEENGLDITTLLQNLAGDIENKENAPPPPQMMYGMNGNMDYANLFFSESSSDETTTVASV